MPSSSGLGQRAPRTFSVVVNGGTGTIEMEFGGNCIGYSIIAPSSSATWSIKFESDSYPLTKAEGLTGDGVCWDEFQIYYFASRSSGADCTIYNATDGTYKVRLWWKT